MFGLKLKVSASGTHILHQRWVSDGGWAGKMGIGWVVGEKAALRVTENSVYAMFLPHFT